MATTFKTFLNNDVTTTKTLLHEAIPITGTIVSGTYGAGSTQTDAQRSNHAELNIKNFSHGMFQSVYDYPFLSSSANHIFDISVGLSPNSNMSGSTKAFATTADGNTAIGSGFGTITVAGGGLSKTLDVNGQFTSAVTVTNGSIDDGSSIITLVTPLGTTITTTANDGTTTSDAVASEDTLAATFDSLANDTTLAAEVASSLNDHAEILAISAGAVVTIQFLSRAVDAHNNRFIGPVTQQEKKVSMYNQMAQVLMGHDKNGAIQRFDSDGEIGNSTDKMDEVIFLNFSRLLVKDEIKKGSFQLDLGTIPIFKTGRGLQGNTGNSNTHHMLTIRDTNAQNDFRINSPAGEYGILSASHTARVNGQGLNFGDGVTPTQHTKASNVGLIFYQAGVIVLTASIFNSVHDKSIDAVGLNGRVGGGGLLDQAVSMSIGGGPTGDTAGNFTVGTVSASVNQMLTGSKIENFANNFRRRVHNISFNNTTELNSTVYFCRANHNEFNYSANPTYLSDSEIRVKDVPTDMPIAYVTSVGLYSPDNELMAVAKLSEPLRKDPTNELTLRVRLDY
jgi:hypothetical protein